MRFTKSCLLSMIVCVILISDIQAQSINYSALQAPKRELRAAWIATVLNIDYPRSPSTDPIALKEQYRNLLDELEKLGMNAVIVQVRPAADALYPSEFAPWSAYLTGRQGAPPKDDFDPLEFMIKETHQRSMEFHAWINPYRASMNMDTSALFLTHPVNQHPDWLLAYNGKMYFNPGIPAVRDHLLDVVGELVDNYNMDGIHIDDYFYPYPAKDKPFPDSMTFKFYGQPYKDINEWRRHNTDLLVESMYERIKSTRSSIQFGVSPFGVWRNKSQDAKGSDTRAGVTSYDDLNADVLKWMNRGWVDYIMPQLYWSIGYEPADHEVLVRWWSRQARDLPLYIGHSVYKIGDNTDATWNDPGEIPRQIDLNRRNFQTQGSAFFSARSFRNNPLRIKDSLRIYYQTQALWPERPELELPKLGPVDLRKPRWKEEAVRLRWKPNVSIAGIKERAHYYVIYRFAGQGVGDLDNPANILAITPIQDEEEKRIEYFDETTRVGETYTYVVTTSNRAHIESKASNSRGIFQKNENRIRRAKPAKVRKGRERTRRVRRRDLRG